MKKIIIILGIILTSGVAALALTNKSNDTNTQVKAEKSELSANQGRAFGAYKSDLANAD